MHGLRLPACLIRLAGILLCGCFTDRATALDRKALTDTYVAAVADLGYFLEPEEGDRRHPRPLCVVLPGGPGAERMAKGTMQAMGKQFQARGWTVVAPYTLDEKSFIGRNGKLVPKLVRDLQSRKDITNDRVVIAGISNGGIAALEIAADHPEMFSAVIVTPGIVSQNTRIDRLKDMPIYLRVGELDRLNWGYAFPRDEKRLLEAGARLDAKLLMGVGHGIRINWNELYAWLDDMLGEDLPVQHLNQDYRTIRIQPEESREVRRWRSKGGNTVVASLLQADEGYAVLRLQSGSRVQIEVDELSSTDRRYLLQLSR